MVPLPSFWLTHVHLPFILLYVCTLATAYQQSLTLLPGLSDDISSTLAHHLGDVEGTISLIGYCHRAVDSLRLHLK
jgi:hypothetical protein